MGFFIMDYKKIYNNLIERAKFRELDTYKEAHHILPKCMGGNNNKENLVYLKAREHYIAHLLLVKIHPNVGGLKIAVWAMINLSNKHHQRTYKVSSRTYEAYRMHSSEITKKWFNDGLNNEKIINRNEKISKALTGKILTDTHKRNISKNHANVSGKNNPYYGMGYKQIGNMNPHSKKVIHIESGKTFSTLLEAAEYFKIDYTLISRHCNGHRIKPKFSFI